MSRLETKMRHKIEWILLIIAGLYLIGRYIVGV